MDDKKEEVKIMNLKEADKLFRHRKRITNEYLKRQKIHSKMDYNSGEEKIFSVLLIAISIIAFMMLDFISNDYFYENGYWYHFSIGIALTSVLVLFIRRKNLKKYSERKKTNSRKIKDLSRQKEVLKNEYYSLISKNMDAYFEKIKEMDKDEMNLFSEEFIKEIIEMKKDKLEKENTISCSIKKVLELEDEVSNKKIEISNM